MKVVLKSPFRSCESCVLVQVECRESVCTVGHLKRFCSELLKQYGDQEIPAYALTFAVRGEVVNDDVMVSRYFNNLNRNRVWSRRDWRSMSVATGCNYFDVTGCPAIAEKFWDDLFSLQHADPFDPVRFRIGDNPGDDTGGAALMPLY